MKTSHIALVAHQVMAAYRASIGDNQQTSWNEASEDKRTASIARAQAVIDNPNVPPEVAHADWIRARKAEGWKPGKKRDNDAKTHPMLIPFEDLPNEQKTEEYLYRAVVVSMRQIAPELEPREAPADGPRRTDLVAVTYIGRDESFYDRLYGSKLTFKAGQTRAVPPELARSFLKHADQFERGTVLSQAQASVQTPQADDTDALLNQAKAEQDADRLQRSDLQDLYDRVNTMDKQALAEYARNNYRQELDQKASTAKLRAQVVGFIDQYGAI